MTWPNARDRLMDDIESIGHPVHLIPPQGYDDEEIHTFLIPPSRDPLRRASHVKRTTYDQNIVVMRHIPNEGDEDVNAIAKSVDQHVEDITTALDTDLQLGGYATSVTAPTWDEMTTVEWPANTGQLYAQMAGRLEIEVETITSFVPLPTEVISLALEGTGTLLLENGNTLVLEG